MASPATAGGIRHAILDLSPLELDCMNALWPRDEATVREIQQALVATRPRAYTTIMTILDRLAQKGVVQRRKAGRAWVYRAMVTEEEARSRAVARLVEGFFDGSSDALTAHLSSHGRAGPETGAQSRKQAGPAELERPARKEDSAKAPPEQTDSAGLETTLL